MNTKHLWALLALALLVACTTTPQQPAAQQPAAEGGDTLAGDTVEINMTARNWEFEPNTVRVKRGDRVRINVQSVDVAHGIGIEGYPDSVKLEANGSATLEFVADKSGSFRFYCNVFCGEGHRNMTGQLIVE